MAVEAVGTPTGTTTGTRQVHSVAITVPADANAVDVSVHLGDANATVSSAVIGAASGSLVRRAPSGNGASHAGEKWVIVNPPVGAQTIVVTLSASVESAMSAQPMRGVDTADPVRDSAIASGDNAAPNVISATVTSVVGDLVTDTVAMNGTTIPTINGAQTPYRSTNASDVACASYKAATAGTTAMSWTNASGSTVAWSYVVVCYRAASVSAELAAGVATIARNNGYFVDLISTAASGGTSPYSYQWQRSPRGAGVWAPLTGATTLTWRDRTITPSTNYDYRVRVTDDASTTADSNTAEADVPAASPVWGALGDSNTDEYRAESNIGGGTPFEATTLNWLELLVAHRGVNAGAWSGTSRGEPRRSGYEYNWARFSAVMAGLTGTQLTGLVGQVQAGTVTHCAIQGTVNELINVAPMMLNDAYLSPDGGVTGQSGTPIATHVADYSGAFITALDTLVDAGAVGVVCILPPNYMEYPNIIADTPDATRRGYVTAMMQGMYDAVEQRADEINALYGYTLVACHRWDGDFAPIWATLSGEDVTVGGASINIFDPAVDGSPYYRSIDGHTGTVFEGIIANTFIDVANTLDGITLSTFSDSEILGNAGIAASGVTGDGAVTLPALVASGSGTVAIAGTGLATLPAITAAGAGSVAIQGEGAATLPTLTASGAGTVTITGAGAVTLPMLVASGSTSQTTTGNGSVILPALVASGTGTVQIQAAGVVSLPPLSAGGTATVLVQGDGSASLPALTTVGTGVVTIVGHGAVTLPMLVVSGGDLLTEPIEQIDITLTFKIADDATMTFTTQIAEELEV